MSTDLLRPANQLSPTDALQLSQQAPSILQKSSWSLPWPLSLLVSSDAPEKWTIYENLFLSCLRTGDDRSAFACLELIRARFGETNERVMGLISIYHEGIAPNEKTLQGYLDEYTEHVEASPTNLVVRKRIVAILKSLGRSSDAITELIKLLDISPTDAEAWSELAELYVSQSMYPQAIYSFEEVLLVTPNAWNIHARFAEVTYLAALLEDGSNAKAASAKGLARSIKSYCRSIELCDDYLRGYYGLKLTTNKLLPLLNSSDTKALTTKDAGDDDTQLPTLKVIQRLNELATSKLAEIIRKHSTGTRGWQGYEEAEVIAARELLDRDNKGVARGRAYPARLRIVVNHFTVRAATLLLTGRGRPIAFSDLSSFAISRFKHQETEDFSRWKDALERGRQKGELATTPGRRNTVEDASVSRLETPVAERTGEGVEECRDTIVRRASKKQDESQTVVSLARDEAYKQCPVGFPTFKLYQSPCHIL